jgi:uncharacterized protein (TIGR03382 family)
VTPTGYTAVVGPSGQVLDRSALGAQQIVEETVPKRTGWTVYVTLGDDAMALLALLALAAAWVVSRNQRHHDSWTLSRVRGGRGVHSGQLDHGAARGNSL